MRDDIHVFGFGSLMNEESLRATVPDAHDLMPAYAKGFTRGFNLWSSTGFTDTNLDVAGIPFCAVDVRESSDADAEVNGIMFTMAASGLGKLLKREHDYKLVETSTYNFHTKELIGKCLMFSASKNNGVFDFNSVPQIRYLQICLEGAGQHGDTFYGEFLNTTFIGNRRLGEVPELAEYCTEAAGGQFSSALK